MTWQMPGHGLWSCSRVPRWKVNAGSRTSFGCAPRHGSSISSPPKKRKWLRIAVVTVSAGVVGAYIRLQQDDEPSTLNPITFAHYRLVSREPVSSTNSIFTLEPTRPADNNETYESAWRAGVWSVMFKQPQLQIGRDYTPLPPIRENSEKSEPSVNTDESLRFLIRRDPHGEVSRYLHALQPGATVEIRGPQHECDILPDVHDILFIAGGTGIAPALQAAYTLLRRTTDDQKPRIHILWANRKREDSIGGVSDSCTDVPVKSSWWKLGRPTQASTTSSEPSSTSFDRAAIVEELQILKSRYPGQITVDYFVDEESSFVGTKEIEAFTQGRTGNQRKMIIVSGPEGFVSYMAGPKLWAQGQELQGPVQGIIKQLDLRGWTVWKL